MFRLLIETCIWLDIAKDQQLQATLGTPASSRSTSISSIPLVGNSNVAVRPTAKSHEGRAWSDQARGDSVIRTAKEAIEAYLSASENDRVSMLIRLSYDL